VNRRLPAALFLPLALALLAGAAARGAAALGSEPAIPEPVGFVNDHAGVMDEPSRARLEAFLDQVKQKTGAEFAVLAVKTTTPLDPAEYKVKVFERWRLGKHGADTGLLLLVAMEERKVWFETGYGLEGVLPDGLLSRIIREEMTPRFRAGDYAGGITAAVLRTAAILARDRGVALEWNGEELRYGGRGSDAGLPVPALVFILVVVLLLFALRVGLGGGYGPSGRRGSWWIGPGPWGGGFGGGGFGGGGGGSW